jgi:hypothetical protein
MAALRRELPASFMYEPSAPPTIPPGLTIADWRREQARRRPRGTGRRKAPRARPLPTATGRWELRRALSVSRIVSAASGLFGRLGRQTRAELRPRQGGTVPPAA